MTPPKVVIWVKRVSTDSMEARLLTSENLKETGVELWESLGNLALVHGKKFGIEVVTEPDRPKRTDLSMILVEEYCPGMFRAVPLGEKDPEDIAYGKTKAVAVGKFLEGYGDKLFPWIEIQR